MSNLRFRKLTGFDHEFQAIYRIGNFRYLFTIYFEEKVCVFINIDLGDKSNDDLSPFNFGSRIFGDYQSARSFCEKWLKQEIGRIKKSLKDI